MAKLKNAQTLYTLPDVLYVRGAPLWITGGQLLRAGDGLLYWRSAASPSPSRRWTATVRRWGWSCPTAIGSKPGGIHALERRSLSCSRWRRRLPSGSA